jgi:protein-tyrosine phosphatase
MHESAPGGGAAGMMADLYRTFVHGAKQQAAFAQALRMIADPGQLPLLFHCSAGKDRTGWLSAVLLTVLGVDRDVIMADYLRTNEASTRLHQVVVGLLEGKVDDPEVILPMVQARAAYLEAAYAEADRRYGGLAGYLRDGLGVDDDLVAALRTNLLD